MIKKSDTRVHSFPLRDVRIERPPASTLLAINDQTLIEPQSTPNGSDTEEEVSTPEETRSNKRKAAVTPVVGTKRMCTTEENRSVSAINVSVLPQADRQKRTSTEQALQVVFSTHQTLY